MDAKVIFESENLENTIVELDDAYMLTGTKHSAVFDKNEKVLHAVIKAINDLGNVQGSKFGFAFVHGGIRMYLAQLVYSTYKNIDANDLKGRKIHYRDRNCFNLMSDNMYLSKIVIDVVDANGTKYIRISTFNKHDGNVFVITNYEEELYEIFKSICLSYNNKMKTFQVLGKKNPYVHDVVWAYYKKGANRYNILEKIVEFKEEFAAISDKNGDHITIDHKKCFENKSRYLNTIENLQALPLRLNALKSTCSSKLQPNCFYKPVLDGEYFGKVKPLNEWLRLWNALNGIELKDYEFCYREDDTKTEQDIRELIDFCKTGELPDDKIKLPVGTFFSCVLLARAIYDCYKDSKKERLIGK